MTAEQKRFITAVWNSVRRWGWAPLSVFILHEICTHVIYAYEKWPSVDIPLHIAGGVAFAVFMFGAIEEFARQAVIVRPDVLTRAVLVFCAVCTAAVFWEFAEWESDWLLGTNAQLSLDDTMLDLAMGVLGGAVVVGIALLRSPAKRA